MLDLKKLSGLAAAVMVGAFALTSPAAVSAAPTPVPTTACDEFSVLTNPAPGTPSLSCIGIFSKDGTSNPDAGDLNAVGIGGINTWAAAGKRNSDGTDGNLIIAGIGNTSGTWGITPEDSSKLYVLMLKGATQWGAWLLSTPPFSGTWVTSDLLTGGKCTLVDGTPTDCNTPELSNAQLFTAPNAIPLPAAAWLMIAGIAGLGAVARRRKAKSA